VTLLRKIRAVLIVPLFAFVLSCTTIPNSCDCSHTLTIVPPTDSFVKIVSYINTTAISTASGVIVAQVNENNTIIATAKHVCVGPKKIRIFDTNTAQYEALILDMNPNHDLCLITTKTKIDFLPVKLSKKKPEIGDSTFNIAAPYGIHDDHMTLLFHGHYAGKYHIPVEEFPLDVYTIPGGGGSSGSPVFNEKWELIGIISRGHQMLEHVMLSVGYEHLYEYLIILEPELPRLAALTIVQDFRDSLKPSPNPDAGVDQPSSDESSTP
jgi:S1-C subfamily serine protease